MSICCIGQSAYDITGRVDGDLRPDTKYRMEHHTESPGGPALNGACVCGLWGADVSLVSRIGKDAYGARITESLGSYGVKTELMIVDPEARTSLSLIVANGATGGRTIFNFPSPHGPVARMALPDDAPSVMLHDGHEPEASLEYMHAFPGALNVIDAGTCRESTLLVARLADYLIASQSFATQYLGHGLTLENDARLAAELVELREINGRRVAVTLGELGSVYLGEDGLVRMPAFKTRVCDSTAAGDIFHGAFTFGVHAGLSMRDSMVLATMASSVSVSRSGSQTSIPSLPEVFEQLLSKGIAIGLGRGGES